jgi:phosphohistidine phosphatase
MHIYLLRHGDASFNSIYSESERPLTDLGRHQATLVGTLLHRMNIVIDVALSSPFKRSQQTASIVLSNINKQQIAFNEILVNGSGPRQLLKQLDELGVSSVLLVGHEPYLSETISMLIGGNLRVEIEMRKCSLAFVDVSIPIHLGAGILKFLIPTGKLA